MIRKIVFCGLLGLCVMASALSAPFAQNPEQALGPDTAVRVHAARLASDGERTRLILDVSGSVESKAFILAAPRRAVIDLPALVFEVDPTVGQQGSGPVSAYRFGAAAPGKSRIVLDLARPALIGSTVFLEATADKPAQLIFELVKTDEASFQRAVATLRPAAMAAVPAQPLKLIDPGLPVIAIDPGHGGIDTGAAATNGMQEKAIVLDFAKALAAKLEASGRYTVVLTRSDDSFISLADRVEIARAHKASLLISLHADTLRDPFGVRGATVYTLSDQASDGEAALYAEKENKADLIAGVDLSAEPGEVADILVDLTRRETKAFSGQFAKTLIEGFSSASRLNKNPLRSAGFRVLKAADVPSVLLELGYLSSTQDVELLTSADWRSRASEAVLVSIDRFFAARAGDVRATGSMHLPRQASPRRQRPVR